MPRKSELATENGEILAKAVENVFRKLIRFLVGRISLVKLQKMLNYIYVQEAEILLKKESPGKNVPLTSLALITGLDSRTVVNIKRNIEGTENKYEQSLMKDLTPECAVIEAWVDKLKDATGQNKNKLRTMKYGDHDSEFEKLCRTIITSRGVTSSSIIQRLLATNSIQQNKTNKTVTLTVDNYSPYLADDEPNMINAAFTAFSNLISTLDTNITSPKEERLFQRQVWTFRLSPDDLIEYRKCLRHLLESTELKAKKLIEPWEEKKYSNDLISAGVGFYYFEDAS